ncbi:MAG: DICT sensory domain-containing protein [Coleofasciculaceae cyanobacterium]
MNRPSTPNFSLYQLVLDNLALPQSLHLSSATLQSLLSTIIEVVKEAKIPAYHWLRLPAGQSWQTQFKQYQQPWQVPQTIYLCRYFGEELGKERDSVDQVVKLVENCQIFPLQLAAGNQLRREYFLIIVSEQFSCLVVTCQRSSTELQKVASRQENQPWLTLCTFDEQLIRLVLESLREVMVVADTTYEELFGDWENIFTLLSADDSLGKSLLAQVIVKQLQRGEKLIGGQARTTQLWDTLEVSLGTSDTQTNKKEEFIRRVAQELRTPLTSMKTALKLLDSAQLKPAQRQRYIQLLNTECDRQNSLIAGILELVELENESQISAIKPIQLIDIIPGIVSTYQPLAEEKGIQLSYTAPVGLPPIYCPDSWLQQIAINLLHNCLKFTSTDGLVRVSAAVQGEYVQLIFSDTGKGIAESEISHIFDIFYRGYSNAGEQTGAGLGLTIVQQLLLRCNGSISVTSKLGEGSDFKVLLPVANY